MYQSELSLLQAAQAAARERLQGRLIEACLSEVAIDKAITEQWERDLEVQQKVAEQAWEDHISGVDSPF